MSEHEKFIFTDLQKSSVVNRNKEDIDNGIEDFINNAVQEHIKKIAQPPTPFEPQNIGSEIIKGQRVEGGAAAAVASESIVGENMVGGEGSLSMRHTYGPNAEMVRETRDSSNAEEVAGMYGITAMQDHDQQNMPESSEKNYEEGKKNVDDSSEKPNIVEGDHRANKAGSFTSAEADIEAIKQQEYQRGFADAKAQLEAESEQRVAEQSEQDQFLQKLLEKLNEIVPEPDFEEKVAKLAAEAISGIAKKLHLVLPVDFEEIISRGLIDKLKKFYKEGDVIITIHPERYELCSQILQLDSIPARFKDNIKILQDENLLLDDCILDWKNTRLEYSKEQLSEEIDLIIERLTNAAE